MLVNLRTVRPATISGYRHVLIRGTSTYKYQTYGDADGPNYHLIHFLTQELHKLEVFRRPETSKVEETIKLIHELNYPIKTAKDLKGIPTIENKLATKILRFLGKSEKKNLSAVNNAERRDQQRAAAIRELQTVEGIGPIKARALIEQGCMSIRQLHLPQYMEMLSPAAQTSLRLSVEDATRHEAEALMASLRETLPVAFEPYLTGSYRREQPRIRNIQLLIFHPSYTATPTFYPRATTTLIHRHHDNHTPPPTNLLRDVVEPLQQKGLISALRIGLSKWHGFYKVNRDETETFRKLDISLMPQPSKAAALLVSTGDDEFIQTCYKKAAMGDMFLNEYGLYRKRSQDVPQDSSPIYGAGAGLKPNKLNAVKNDHTRDKSLQWDFVETSDEAALLHELGMGYIVPGRRNFANLRRVGRSQAERSSVWPGQSFSSV